MSDDHRLEHADEQGRYLLGTRIATGGMGEVWRATDTLLGRPVAIKLLKAEYSDHPDFRARFETEARHAAALSHPGVAAVFDVGEAPDGRPFLVMELVAGEPLDALLEPGREMPPESARALLHQAAVAVAAAHAAGIVHRDLKPGNLLVTADAQVKITDFGIARATDSVPLTQTGQIIGTPQYISPEQAEGGTATPASDVYALGVLLFECLAGHRPFTAETPVALALAHLRDPVPPLPDDVPADLVAIVEKALAKDPADRFPDAAAFAEALVDPSVVLPEEPTRTSLLAALPALAGLAGRGPRTGPRTGPGTGPRSGPRTGPRTGPGTGSRTGPRTGPQSGTATAARTGAGTRLRSWPRRTDTAQTPRHRPVSPWLAVLPAALVAGLVAWIVIGSTESPSAGTASVAGSSAKPVASKVIDIRPEDYLDRPADEAQAELEELGLVVERLPTANPDGSEEPGTVATITPVGRLERGDAITLNVWRSPPSAAPASSTSTGSTGGDRDGKDDRDGPGGEASASGKGDSKGPDGGPRGKGKKKR